MSLSYSLTVSISFSITHAKKIASKVATDLLRYQNFYGKPSNQAIDEYEEELVHFLMAKYLSTVTYGFKRHGKWIEAIKYRTLPDNTLISDEDPGRLRPKPGVIGAPFTSYLTYSQRWWLLTNKEKEIFKTTLPFQRTDGNEPKIENGYWMEDRTYGAGGRGIGRSTIRRW